MCGTLSVDNVVAVYISMSHQLKDYGGQKGHFQTLREASKAKFWEDKHLNVA